MEKKFFDLIKSPMKGTNLIEASAGTGKTYAIAGLFLRLILEKGILIDRILAVTYTEAATEELRNRIRERLRQALVVLFDEKTAPENDELIAWVSKKYKGNESAAWRLKDALSRFDEASICTIHGFCRRMLSENAFESNSLFDAVLITDQSDLVRGIVYDFWRKNFYAASRILIQYANKINITPSYFLYLKNFSSIDPHFKVIPEVKKPNIADIENKFLYAYKTLKTKWESHRVEVQEILLNHAGLNRNRYNRNVQNWIYEMDSYFESDNPVMIFEKFARFTSQSIQSSVKKGFDVPENEFFDLCDDYMEIYVKAESVFDKYIKYIEFEFFKFLNKEAVRRKQHLNRVGFDDLLINMHNALIADPDSRLARAVRERYSAALIDEFQDTDPVQYDIFRTIFGSGDSILFLIGDPKQSIYKFRGADIFAYISALGNINNRYTLEKNWRSSPDLLKAVNALFKNKKNPFVFKEIEFNEMKPGREIATDCQIKTDKKEKSFQAWIIGKEHMDMKGDKIGKGRAESLISKAVAGEIYRLVCLGRDGLFKIDDADLKPGNIAVLVRKKRQAAIVQQELYKYNIPSVLYGSESVFISHEAMEMERLAAAVADPGHEKRFTAALSTDLLGFSGNDIFKLTDDENRWEEYLNRFYEYHDAWARSGFFRMFMSLITKEKIRERLLSYVNGERRMTNIMHLAELMHRAETDKNLRMEALVKWIEEKMADPEDSDELQIRLETDEDAVRLITVHRSKGLEFPVVFCPFTWENSAIDNKNVFTFHDPYRDYKLTLDLEKNENNKRIAESEELAENVRLLYVALTRASCRCYLFLGKINKTETSALSYLCHHRDENESPDLMENLKAEAGSLSFDSMINDIRQVGLSSGNTIDIREMIFQNYAGFKRDQQLRDNINCRKFTGTIKRDWRVSSFTALTGTQREFFEAPDHDRPDSRLLQSLKADTNNEENDIFSFPRGANSGTCIHEIFEKLDFTDMDNQDSIDIINRILVKYNFSTEWQDTIYTMVFNVVNTPLLDDTPNFSLKNIPNDLRLNELEFHMPLKAITSKGLADIFRGSGFNKLKDFPALLEKLGFKPHRGILKGFIDMAFEYNNRFYIIDWKSNYLGSNISDYSTDMIETVMKENYYILQYYLYITALNRFLMKRKSGYDYNRHFGGIFYLFIRGIDPANPATGIFYDLPSIEIINSFDEYLAGTMKIIQ